MNDELADTVDAHRFADLYQCRDPVRITGVLLLRAELERRIYLQCTDVFREDIVRRYSNSPTVLLQPYRDHLENLTHGREFAVQSWAHQIAMYDVARAVRESDVAVRDCIDTLLGELVDDYGQDDEFYALVRDSPWEVRSRMPFTPGTTALFREHLRSRADRRTLVGWMREGPRTPIEPCAA